MKKTIAALALAGAMTLSLVACGNNDDPASSVPPVDESVSAPVESTPDESMSAPEETPADDSTSEETPADDSTGEEVPADESASVSEEPAA